MKSKIIKLIGLIVFIFCVACSCVKPFAPDYNDARLSKLPSVSHEPSFRSKWAAAKNIKSTVYLLVEYQDEKVFESGEYANPTLAKSWIGEPSNIDWFAKILLKNGFQNLYIYRNGKEALKLKVIEQGFKE